MSSLPLEPLLLRVPVEKAHLRQGGPHSTPSSVINSFCLTWTAAHCSSLGFIRRLVLPHVLCGGSPAHTCTHSIPHVYTAWMHTVHHMHTAHHTHAYCIHIHSTHVHTLHHTHTYAHCTTYIRPRLCPPTPGAEGSPAGPLQAEPMMTREPQSLPRGECFCSVADLLAAFGMFFWNWTFLDRGDWCIGDPSSA